VRLRKGRAWEKSGSAVFKPTICSKKPEVVQAVADKTTSGSCDKQASLCTRGWAG
jgi:hypothetical protein